VKLPARVFKCIGQTERLCLVKFSEEFYQWLKLYLHCSVNLHGVLLNCHTGDLFFEVVVVVVVVSFVFRLVHLRSNINYYLWHFTLFNFSSCDSVLTLKGVSIRNVHQCLVTHGPWVVTGPQILVRALRIQILEM
jgi:hypothetical protein